MVATSPGIASTPSFGKVSSRRSLEPTVLLGTFGSFTGSCCHGFIVLITLDVDIHVNVSFLARPDEWPREVGDALVGWPGKLARSEMFEAVFLFSGSQRRGPGGLLDVAVPTWLSVDARQRAVCSEEGKVCVSLSVGVDCSCSFCSGEHG